MRKDLTGMRFGRLVVVKPTENGRGGRFVWECVCDCGGTKLAQSNDLTRGKIKSCGCSRTRIDIAGMRFGRLTAIKPTERKCGSHVLWECLCDCGQYAYAASSNLRRGQTRSCGCLRDEVFAKQKERQLKNARDFTGQKIGRLQVVEKITQGQPSLMWRCVCDCGNTVLLSAAQLRNHHRKSCGCANIEHITPDSGVLSKNVRGTEPRNLNNKPSKKNTSGVRGVCFSKTRGVWRAYISFQGVTHNLGSYKNIDDAAAARAEAEKQIFGPFLEWYENVWLKKSKQAQDNVQEGERRGQ